MPDFEEALRSLANRWQTQSPRPLRSPISAGDLRADIASFEERHRLTLPDDYKLFLHSTIDVETEMVDNLVSFKKLHSLGVVAAGIGRPHSRALLFADWFCDSVMLWFAFHGSREFGVYRDTETKPLFASFTDFIVAYAALEDPADIFTRT